MVPLHGATTWCHYMVPLHGATTWCYYMVLLHGATTWYYNRVLLQGTITGYYYRVLLKGIITGYYYRVLLQGTITGFSNCHVMEFEVATYTIRSYLMLRLRQTPYISSSRARCSFWHVTYSNSSVANVGCFFQRFTLVSPANV
jgi:hypothetical protein